MKQNIFNLLIAISFFGFAQKPKEAFNISANIKGLKQNEKITLAYYFGDKQYIQDTARTDKNGKVTFTGENPLDKGMYILVMPNKKYIEFPVNIDSKIAFDIDTNGSAKSIKVTQSEELKRFLSYTSFLEGRNAEVEEAKAWTPKNKDSKDSLEKAKKLYEEINNKVENFQKDFSTKNSNDLLAYIFNINKKIETPEIPKASNGRPDSLFAWHFQKAHYWDGMNWNDERILRTPIFHQKIKTYFDQYVMQHPDSICNDAEQLVTKAKNNKDLKKYCIFYPTVTYERSNIMGMDQVFVCMVEKYYVTGQVDWLKEDQVKKVIKRAEDLSPNMIGKLGKPISGFDTANVKRALYDVKSPLTLLVFWESTCGHCIKTIPRVDSLYKSYLKANGCEVFAVTLEHKDLKGWKKYIKEHKLDWINIYCPYYDTEEHDFRKKYDVYSTPVIYILDENKKILAKRLAVEQIKDFIERYKKIKNKTK